MVAECNPGRGQWTSKLLILTGNGYSALARFEDHASHPGQHVHSHCGRSGIEVGGVSLDSLARIPPAGARHSRVAALTLQSFWQAARKMYRVHDDLGPLFAHVA